VKSCIGSAIFLKRLFFAAVLPRKVYIVYSSAAASTILYYSLAVPDRYVGGYSFIICFALSSFDPASRLSNDQLCQLSLLEIKLRLP
jgi:hypothetical protein